MAEDFPYQKFLKLDALDKRKPNNFNSLPNLSESFLKKELPSVKSLNRKIHSQLLEIIEKEVYDAYFKESFEVISIENYIVVFLAANEYLKGYIQENFTQTIKQILHNILGEKYEIRINVKVNSALFQELDSEEQELALNFEQPKDPMTQSQNKGPSFTIDLNPTDNELKDQVESKYIEHVNNDSFSTIDTKKTFDNFVVGPSNNMAFASCVAVAKNPGKSYPTVYLHSKSGLGKTHLLHAVANHIVEKDATKRIMLVTAQKFLQEMVESIREQKIELFRKKYTDQLDVLMIDDIHELKNKHGLQNAFFHIFNDLYSKGKQLIFTSDKTPKEIDGVEERIKTRLSWGLVLDIQQPDLETRIAILKHKAQEEDVYLPDDVSHLIASCIKDNIRELEGSLIKLAAYSSIFKQEITTEIAQRELRLDDIQKTEKITLERVAKAVSQQFKVPVVDLKSKSRLKEVATARHIAMYLSYKLADATLDEIGLFYNKDHSSVVHANNKIKKAVKDHLPISHTVLEIENKL